MPSIIKASLAAQHVLGAGATFVHPGNGNVYILSCEKIRDRDQNLVIYRRRPPYDLSIQPEIIKVYDGMGKDSDWQITMGAAVILPTGSLYIAFSTVPKGMQPSASDSGYAAVEDLMPGIDEPYPLASAYTAMVSGAQPLPAIPLPPITKYPNNGIPYKSDADLLSNSWLHIRFNKLTEVLLRHSKVLEQHEKLLHDLGLLT